MRFDNRMLYSGLLLLMLTFHETQGSLDIKANVQSQSLAENEVLTILMTQVEELKQELQEIKPKLKELEQTCAQKKDISVLGEESMPSSEPTECRGCDPALPDVWVSDSGYIINMSALPTESMIFDNKDDYTSLKVMYRIGPIKVHGSRNVPSAASCQDVFLHGPNPSGWYLLGEPESLYAAFCQNKPFDGSNEEKDSKLKNAESVNAEHVKHSLEFNGFTSLKQEQIDGLIKFIKLFEEHPNQLIGWDEQFNKAITMGKFLEKFENQLALINNDLSFVNKIINEQQRNLDNINEVVTSNNNSLLEYSSVSSPNRIVTFHAYTSKSWYAGDVIKYDVVTINEFLGYNADTGVFTAPVSGVYYLAAQSYKVETGDAWYHMVKNGGYISFANHADNAGYDTVGMSVVVELDLGDIVYVIREGDTEAITINAYEGSTAFLGFLLYQT